MTPLKHLPRDPRPAHVFGRYHRRARRSKPRAQALALAVLLPVLMLIARVRIRGQENIPSGGFIAAANHPSLLDAIFVAVALRRRVHFMGKSDLFRGVKGRWYARLGGFPVRRGVWDHDAFQTAESVLSRGRVMAMFPEGGVSPVGGYRPAKAGIGHIAHRCGATVLPIHLDGVRKLYRPWTWPKVTVTVGRPFTVEQIDEPSREQSQRVADLTLKRIVALAPDR